DERAAGLPGDRHRPDKRALSRRSTGRRGAARAAESPGPGAAAVWLPSPARAVAARGLRRQQEAGAAALPRGAADGTPARRPQAGDGNTATDGDAVGT